MIYIDASVLLSRVFAEGVTPPDAFWQMPLVSSRLLQYEVWVRVNARPNRLVQRPAIELLMNHIELIELDTEALGRALQPFPMPLRTLDALHLSTMEFLRRYGQEITLASYDHRLRDAAAALGISAAVL